ncbi:flagellar assembly protein FliW [Desulfoscipio gibsoniae]|uniref:Flagellar assembly factor FliW n=1 Tax=Desulfoscipio gibsoniae DSM 7213 TaxID=767817 RepID=R4KGH1_9FIRM|nr:flagellar assembly protein FliW [Desulfoscipio gibsoniae]AGL01699.1 hypothetical protein Desgi_2277 [Desulfoscipio gibsoniae DSM 7213]
MQVRTTRFGNLKIDEQKIINFPKGIPGFRSLHRFFMLPVKGADNMQWLQAVEDPAVALLLIDPFLYFKGYVCNLPDHDIEELGLQEPSEALVLTTITVPRDNPAAATANLVAPIVINTRLNKAKQVILNNSPYTTKHMLFPKTTEKTSGGEGV